MHTYIMFVISYSDCNNSEHMILAIITTIQIIMHIIMIIVHIIIIIIIMMLMMIGPRLCLHFSICACHPCAGAMVIFSVSFQY